MNREKQIAEMAILTCGMYCRDREKKCAAIQECDLKCCHYQRCEVLYDNAGYRKHTEWSSVNQPPKEFGKYLVACKGIDVPQIRLWEGTWDSLAEVTHWQPLPKLP